MNEKLIEACYQHLLGRRPENNNVVLEKACRLQSLNQTLNEFTQSVEFQDQLPRFNLTNFNPIFELDNLIYRVPITQQPNRLDQHFNRVNNQWNKLGKTDAFWSVITDVKFLSAHLPSNYELFWKTGVIDCQRIISKLSKNNLYFPSDEVFEFGCGVGRITRALEKYYRHIFASDVSKYHLEIARENVLNSEKVTFFHCDQLSSFKVPHHDVFVSLITLQHNTPSLQYYLIEKILKQTKSVGVFQVCVATRDYQYPIRLNKMFSTAEIMDMHILPVDAISRLLTKHKFDIVAIDVDSLAGDEFVSFCIYVSKNRN